MESIHCCRFKGNRVASENTFFVGLVILATSQLKIVFNFAIHASLLYRYLTSSYEFVKLLKLCDDNYPKISKIEAHKRETTLIITSFI